MTKLTFGLQLDEHPHGYSKSTGTFTLLNGDFSGATIEHWSSQSMTVTFEVFDTENAVHLADSGNISLLKQSVDTIYGVEYSFTARVHNNNIASAVGVTVYDGDWQSTLITTENETDALNTSIISDASISWQDILVTFTAIGAKTTIGILGIGVQTARVTSVIPE